MKFAIDLNLDDESECSEFIKKHGTGKGRWLANRLGFKGEGSAKGATALSCYAWNKITAFHCRKRGEINTALVYEEICDRIYKEDIQPFIECW